MHEEQIKLLCRKSVDDLRSQVLELMFALNASKEGEQSIHSSCYRDKQSDSKPGRFE